MISKVELFFLAKFKDISLKTTEISYSEIFNWSLSWIFTNL